MRLTQDMYHKGKWYFPGDKLEGEALEKARQLKVVAEPQLSSAAQPAKVKEE